MSSADKKNCSLKKSSSPNFFNGTDIPKTFSKSSKGAEFLDRKNKPNYLNSMTSTKMHVCKLLQQINEVIETDSLVLVLREVSIAILKIIWVHEDQLYARNWILH